MPSSSHEGDMLTFNTFFLTQLRVMCVLLRILVLPIDQNLDYDFAMSTGLFTPITTFLSLALLIGLAVICWKMFKRDFIVFFGLLWFFITYLPEFYPRVHVIFEHKLYLTSIGLFIAFAYMLWEHPALKRNALWIMIALSIVLGICTVKRNMVWRTEQTLWEDVVKKSPNKYRANLNLGNVYQLQGQYDRSLPYYDKAIAVMPYGYKALNSRAVVYYMKGDLDKAVADLDRSIKANPLYDDPYNNRANLYRQRGEFKKAIEDYTTAIKVSQFAPIAYKNRADVYVATNEIEKALADYRIALNLDPGLRDGYNNMGNLLRQRARFPEALDLFNAALKNDPGNSAEYFLGRGNVYTDMKNPQKALSDFLSALKFRPAMPEAFFNTGIAYATMGDLTKAEEFYSLALQAMPNLAVAYNNRGDTRRKMGRYADAILDLLAADRLAPHNDIIRKNIILSYLESGQTDNAVKAFNETISQGGTFDEKFRQEFLQKTANAGKK
jgi:tetratricopeptide (TPR) repeat protein